MKTKFHLIIGLLLIIVAAFFIISITGIIPAQHLKIIASWQAIIIFLGVAFLFTKQYIKAAISLVVGSYFFIPHIFSIYNFEMPISKSDFTNIFIASLLIIIAFTIIFKGKEIKENKNNPFFDIKPNKNGLPRISCAFGATSHTVIEKPFKGAYVNTNFGEMTINMSKTSLPDGDSYLDIYTSFGSTILLIPKSWNIHVVLDTAFGHVINEMEGRFSDNGSRLIIRGAVSFGELKIHSLLTEQNSENSDNEKEETIENISVKHNNRVHIIMVDELQYIQADGDYVTLCTAQGKFLKEQTMKYFQNNLPLDRFIRIHRSYIVNLSEITSVDSRGKEIYYVTLKSGASLRASTAGYQLLKEKLGI